MDCDGVALSRWAGRSNIVGELTICPGANPSGHLTHSVISDTADHLAFAVLLSSFALFAGGRQLCRSLLRL